MSDIEFEMWYCIQRYNWAKEKGVLDEEYPVIGIITPPLTDDK